MLMSDAFKDAMIGNWQAELNSEMGSAAIIQFFDGTLPAATTDPDSGSVIAQCAFSNPAYSTATPPTITAAAISPDTSTAAGTITYWRVKNVGGVVIFQGTVSTTPGAADIIFDSLAFGSGDTLNLNTLTFQITVAP